MVSLEPHLTALYAALPPAPVEQSTLDEAVDNVVKDTKDNTAPENRRAQWEQLLREDTFALAANEGRALKDDPKKYYNDLTTRLDVVLTFAEHDICDSILTFVVLQDIMEIQTIESCAHVFEWIELRSPRLITGMVAQKTKALSILRTLNDVLRRLPKTGDKPVLSGRLLTFLSGIFPLGERSGVNLRAEYGPAWQDVKYPLKHKDEDEAMKTDEDTSAPEEDKMQVDTKKVLTEEEKKADFYDTFWRLQRWLASPPLFMGENGKKELAEFKAAVNKVIPILKEATAKERVMLGSRAAVNGTAVLKRKRDPDEETNLTEFFFAKYLTSPELLDLEIADTQFRRQIMFQILIVLTHLARPRADTKVATNFTLEDSMAEWVTDTRNKVLEELKQTSPNGRLFAETAQTILDRESNWVNWKNASCPHFDKKPWSETIQEIVNKKVVKETTFDDLFKATEDERKKMRVPKPEWQYALGTERLTEIWEEGYRDLDSLKDPSPTGDVYTFAKKVKIENFRISQRRKQLAAIAARRKVATPTPPPVQNPTPTAPPSITTTQDGADKTDDAGGASGPSSANSSLHPSLPPRPSDASMEGVTSSEAPASIPPPVVEAAPKPTPAPAPAPVAAPKVANEPVDPIIAGFQDDIQRWAWLGLRSARETYFQHFGVIENGDLDLLVAAIENSKLEKQKNPKGEKPSGPAAEEHGSQSPSAAASATVEGEGDAKMETA